MVDHDDPIGELVGLVQVLRREQQGGAVRLELADERPHVDPAPRIEARRGLVEEEHVRTPDEAGRQVEPSAHATRVGLGRAISGIGEVEAFEHLGAATPSLSARQVVQAPDQLQVLEAGQVLVDGGALAGQADAEAELLGVAHDVEAGDLGAPGTGEQQGGEDPHGGRLACAVRAEHAEHGAALDLQIDAPQRMDLSEVSDETLGEDDGSVSHRAPSVGWEPVGNPSSMVDTAYGTVPTWPMSCVATSCGSLPAGAG